MRLRARRIEVDDHVGGVALEFVPDATNAQRALVHLKRVAARTSDPTEALGAFLVLRTASKCSDSSPDSLREEEAHVDATKLEARRLRELNDLAEHEVDVGRVHQRNAKTKASMGVKDAELLEQSRDLGNAITASVLVSELLEER